MMIMVGSTNPLKVGAVNDAAVAMLDGSVTVEGMHVASGVADQPWGDEETLTGARTRADLARATGRSGCIGVGIEAGLVDHGDGCVESTSWVVATDGRQLGRSRAASYLLPYELAVLVLGGMSLGDATDVAFAGAGLSRTVGTVGPLTGGAIERRSHYAAAVTLALIPFRPANAGL